MGLKKRNKIDASFSMASMTDIIFLLLFFVISSTMSSPNDIKLNLPQSSASSSTKSVIAKVSIDSTGVYYVAKDAEAPQAIDPELLESFILDIVSKDTTTYIALHADQNIAYKEVVKVLDIANKNKLKLVIATQGFSK